jgi:hypothetical protein
MPSIEMSALNNIQQQLDKLCAYYSKEKMQNQPKKDLPKGLEDTDIPFDLKSIEDMEDSGMPRLDEMEEDTNIFDRKKKKPMLSISILSKPMKRG